ncbi:unnamed protein product [Mytilus coruscus]|uniref:Peptidase A2 domain-containing protein n=1 Tax=Mytilus coruscus TaxID=42192 RepID=A0A6J8BGI7_MYTCO|nr:unnamed protein product [Mytilus coruscus]
MLVDSGASVSILRKDFFDSLVLENRPQVMPVRMNLLTATGEASEFIGKVNLEIKLGTHVFKHEFLLAEIKDMAILGMDFLMTNSIDVLFSKGCLRIKDEFITCFTNKGDSSCCRISIAETVDIPPDSEMLIKGMPCGPVIFNEVGLVETNKSFIEKTGLLLARVVVQPNSNIIPLRVANFSTEPVKVYKNTIVGTFEPVDIETFEVSTVSRVNCAEIKTEVGIPDHLKCVFEKSSKDLDNIEVKKLKEFLCSYQDVFSKSPSDIGHTEIVNHKINTGNAKPIKLKPYRLPLAKREVAEKEIQDMASRGIIEPSSSAWCSPVVMVPKKKTKIFDSVLILEKLMI